MKTGRIIRLVILFFILSLLCSFLVVSCTPKKGFIGDAINVYCPYSSDQYCYRNAAVQALNSAWCEKIEQATSERSSKQNVAKDSCYMMIAIQTKDKLLCDKIIGKDISLSKEKCLDSIN